MDQFRCTVRGERKGEGEGGSDKEGGREGHMGHLEGHIAFRPPRLVAVMDRERVV